MKTVFKESFKMFLALILAGILFCLVSYVNATHNYDPNNPDTQKDRGYNKENCEKWKSEETGRNGIWLGHIDGCLLDGMLFKEFTVESTNKKSI